MHSPTATPPSLSVLACHPVALASGSERAGRAPARRGHRPRAAVTWVTASFYAAAVSLRHGRARLD